MSKYLAVIQGDMNDADYKSTELHFDDQEEDDIKQLEILRKGAALIKEFNELYPHARNWGEQHHMNKDKYPDADNFYIEKLGEEDSDWFFDMLGGGGDYPIHTIESITLYKISKTEELL